ncbi:peptidoglycan-binding protein [Clostridium peptidivorans]|uniref:peptidoglycan-binding protein n=1 Tax=Clostridium peptidivorans TaxID=100174 RepID=UPI000BE40987|nr:peptidoglycan-binding protein [Clostridium peptidivorans]
MKKLKSLSLSLIIALLFSSTSFAHPGRTDSNGGHHVRTSGWGYEVGTYHYHSGPYAGYTVNYSGEIPQAFKTKSTNISSATSNYGQVQKIQTKLNSLGYNCGTPDGIMGAKTKEAIMKFQKANKMVVDGIPGPQTLRKLGL